MCNVLHCTQRMGLVFDAAKLVLQQEHWMLEWAHTQGYANKFYSTLGLEFSAITISRYYM